MVASDFRTEPPDFLADASASRADEPALPVVASDFRIEPPDFLADASASRADEPALPVVASDFRTEPPDFLADASASRADEPALPVVASDFRVEPPDFLADASASRADEPALPAAVSRFPRVPRAPRLVNRLISTEAPRCHHPPSPPFAQSAPHPMNDPSLPRHIALVLDGNGRWACERGLPRTEGHEAGAFAVRRAVRAAADRGIENLTLYAFSSANWVRPKAEVDALMRICKDFAEGEREDLIARGIRVVVAGELDDAPTSTRRAVERLIARANPAPA